VQLIVIASIHQPSTSTFQLFDKLCQLAKGQTCYFGPAHAVNYFATIGYQMPPETNPAEFYLDLINTDLNKPDNEVVARVQDITTKWSGSFLSKDLAAQIEVGVHSNEKSADLSHFKQQKPSAWKIPFVLLHRSWIKLYRDIVAYEIRIVMYLGFAILMDTTWLRLGSQQKYIQPFTNALFLGSAFMSFMAVAYVPAFLEDLHTFSKERANGLAGPSAFMFANFLIGLPYIFLIALLYSVITYWLTGYKNDGIAFMRFLIWLFLDLVAAESLVMFVSVIVSTLTCSL
jgi:hypothetical protein